MSMLNRLLVSRIRCVLLKGHFTKICNISYLRIKTPAEFDNLCTVHFQITKQLSTHPIRNAFMAETEEAPTEVTQDDDFKLLGSFDEKKPPRHQGPLEPLQELNVNSSEIVTLNNQIEAAEFVDEIAPPTPVSFNLAGFVNQSESLKQLVNLGVDLAYIEQRANKAKYILTLDFEKDMKIHIQFLYDNGVPADDLGVLITKNPFIFKVDLEDMQIRINYLRSKKFTDSAIARIITRNPYYLSLGTKTVDSRLGFFQRKFFLTGDEVRLLIAKRPMLVTVEFEKLKEKIFVLKEEMGFTCEQMKRLLLMKPKVYTLGRKSLTERFNIVHNMMGISQERILEYPGILLKRGFMLRQRHQYLTHLGRAQYDPEEPGFVSLLDLATTTDYSFCQKCAKTSTDAYNEFLKTV